MGGKRGMNGVGNNVYGITCDVEYWTLGGIAGVNRHARSDRGAGWYRMGSWGDREMNGRLNKGGGTEVG